MIHTSELRIGNIIGIDGYFHKVIYLEEGIVCTLFGQDKFLYNYTDAYYIELDAFVLGECGFQLDADLFDEQDKRQFVLFKSEGRERIIYDETSDTYKYIICDFGIDKIVGVIVKTLSQLQNIYWILNKKELDVKV